MSARTAAMSPASPPSFPPTALNARRVTVGRIRLPPEAMTDWEISVRRGASDSMASRIVRSTRSSSRETPKSQGVVIRRTLPVFIEDGRLYNCWVREGPEARPGRARSGRAARRGLRDRHVHVAVVLHRVADGGGDCAQVRMDHRVAVADPVREHDDGEQAHD